VVAIVSQMPFPHDFEKIFLNFLDFEKIPPRFKENKNSKQRDVTLCMVALPSNFLYFLHCNRAEGWGYDGICSEK
jgi:hypothetical protein